MMEKYEHELYKLSHSPSSFSHEDAVIETLVLFLFSKFTISASFLIIYPFAGELYPTPLRGIGIGFSAYVAGLGLIIIPFVTYLVSMRPVMVVLVYKTRSN